MQEESVVKTLDWSQARLLESNRARTAVGFTPEERPGDLRSFLRSFLLAPGPEGGGIGMAALEIQDLRAV